MFLCFFSCARVSVGVLYMRLYSNRTGVCALSSCGRPHGSARHLKKTVRTVFPLWWEQVFARYSPIQNHKSALWRSCVQLRLQKTGKVSASPPGRYLCVCVCVCTHASWTLTVVCGGFVVKVFLYPIQEEAEFCVTLVYWQQKWPLKQQLFF